LAFTLAANGFAFTKYGYLMLVQPRTAAKLKNKCSCLNKCLIEKRQLEPKLLLSRSLAVMSAARIL